MNYDLTKSEVFEVVKSHGPIIPIRIKKVIGRGDSVIVGAYLSQLLKSGDVKITSVKIGGSPFYYVSGQESKLDALSEHLNEKDKRTYFLLREKNVLRDSTQEPLVRVSLRNIPDFAKKVNVNLKSGKELFWKHYSLSDSEAVEHIKNLLGVKKPEPVKEEVSKPKVQEEVEKEVVEKQDAQTRLDPKPIQRSDMSEFETRVRSYFISKEIEVLSFDQVRNNREYDFHVNIPTSVGKAEYFCKCRNKKSVNEGDLSSAYLAGLKKRLPVLFITTGEVNKSTKESLSEEFKGLILKEKI